MLRRVRRRSWLGIVGLGLGLLLGSLSPGIAWAHGKEITIEVSTLTPDPQQPRTRLYRAFVFFTGDREPVEGAMIALTIQRRQGGEVLPPVRLEPLNIPGFYAAQVTYPRYGTYEIKMQAKEPGEGVANFVDEVLPAALSREPEPGSEGGGKSIFTLSLSFNWRDVRNLAMRWLHSVAAGAWFGLSGLIVAAFWFLRGESRAQFWRRFYPLFPWLAGASLVLLTATGVYNAVYNSPIRPPGVLSLEIMRRIPYGTTYLAALGLKALAVGMGVGLAVAIAKGLRRAAFSTWGNPTAATGEHPSLLPLAVANLTLGLITMLGVAVLIYLHNLSHLAVLVPTG